MAGSFEDYVDLWRRVREGSEDAARELVAGYEDLVRNAIRDAIGTSPRASAVDSVDVAQMAWRSFFRTINEHDFDTPEKLTALLVTMARNKAIMEERRSTAQKRDRRREVPLDRLPGGGSQLPDREPSLTDVAICQEHWERLLAACPERYRQIVELRSARHTYKEIGEVVGLDDGSVRRIMRTLFEKFLGLSPGKGRQ